MSPDQPQHRPLTWHESLPADKRHLAWTPQTTVTLTLGLPDGTRTVWQRKISLATGDLAWNVASYTEDAPPDACGSAAAQKETRCPDR